MVDKHSRQAPTQRSNVTHRRRAPSNYQTLEDPPSQAGPGRDQNPVQRHSDVFELLRAKFGFQEGSVLNQREHLECWLLNRESRAAVNDPDAAVRHVHERFFRNYKKWCTFIGTRPLLDESGGPASVRQIALFLLIWGEAGNLRFMPECLCFFFHKLAAKLDGLESMPTAPEGSFLRLVVRPLYNAVAKMRAQPTDRPLDHKNITNYDDVNELFWSRRCLDFDERCVAEAVNLQEHKTFKERRSFLNPFLAFFRIYFFLLVMLHLLIVICYVAYRSDPARTSGFNFYSDFMTPDIEDIRNHAFYSIFITFSFLLALKTVLEVWIGGARIFDRLVHASALFIRLVWHSIFFALFLALFTSPYEKFGGQQFLDMGLLLVLVYVIPVVLVAILQMTCKSIVWRTGLLNALDGTQEDFIGRHMAQPWGPFLAYSTLWTVIFVCKFLFNLQLMVKPLMGPTVEIYSIHVASSMDEGLIESHHNIAFIVAMWAPLFLVYIYDSQIWLAIMQAVVGGFLGLKLKIGHSARISEFVQKLSDAPALFDSRVVSNAAKGQASIQNHPDQALSAGTMGAQANSRLRFAVVWNEIVSSYRLSDLLDDRETAILQYQISDSGAVEDPVFLLAGQAQQATDIASKAKQKRMSDDRLCKELQKHKVLGCAQNALDIGLQILRQLLGPRDQAVVKVFEQILTSGRIDGSVNLVHLPLVKENVVDLLASLLDLPEPAIVPSGGNFAFQHDLVLVVVERVGALLQSVELMLEEEWMAESMRHSVFAQTTPDLAYQKEQLLALFQDAASGRDSSNGSHKASGAGNESVISLSTRLFFLLTLDAADALPRCHEARRRMSFFLNSLSMKMPTVESIAAMYSFSVITPYYNEPVLYSIDELNGRVTSNPLFQKVEHKSRDLSILKYLITFHSDEWGNFLERVGVTTLDEALAETPTQVRLWASMRGQTLARTVHGMMMYEDALKMLRWLEIGSDTNLSHLDKIKHMDRIAGLKFSYVTSCQIYADQLASNDVRAADIDLLMRKYPNWRVCYVDTIYPPAGSGTEPRHDCVLVKSDGDEIVEVYRYELPGHPLVGEGKPENQNLALPFTRGEYVQTIDMNQEHYFEECLKIPNFLATATEQGQDVTIVGMKEHIFTGRASSLAHFMTLQELVFVSLTQRVLANPLRSRMHYGHPDVFDKSFIMSHGGVSKASKGINLSEDVFSGYNTTLRGGTVTHQEFMQCGKGRDVTLSQINAFEAKLSNGSAEASLSRESHRMGAHMDFFRLNSMFYGHMGFYICNGLVVLCVFAYAYSKLYISLHDEIQNAAITKTNGLDDLAQVLNTQFIFQFGMLMTIPLIATMLVEAGWRQAVLDFVQLVVTLGPVFYIFETGTKAHFFDVAIMRGGSKYRGTGRGFAIVRETLVNFFKEYAASHYRKAMELLGLMILFGTFGNFAIGTDALEDYCATADFDCDKSPDKVPDNITLMASYGSKGQDYGIASFAVYLLGVCWLVAPFFFNTDGLDFGKTRVDVADWLRWMMASPAAEVESSLPSTSGSNGECWNDFFLYEASQLAGMRWKARVVYMIRELRHPLTMYYVFMLNFNLADLGLLAGCVGGVALVLWLGSYAGMCLKNQACVARSILYIVFVIGALVAVPFIIGSVQGWTFEKSLSLMLGIIIGLYSVLQYLILFHGAFNLPVAHWGLVRELAFLFDMITGLFLVLPLLLLSALPFMSTLQTRMMYNGGFSRALSSGAEYAASLSVLVGVLGGWVYGWLTCLVFSLGFVNAAEDNFYNESFAYFIDQELGGDFPMDMLKVYAAAAGAVGALLGTGLAHVIGRRYAGALSCIVAGAGCGLVFLSSSSMVIVGCCLTIAGVSMLSIACMLYSFEVCMVGWQGKGVLMFLFGSAIGYFVEAILVNNLNATTMREAFGNKPLHDWQYHFLFGAIPLVLLLPSWFFIPESPFWLYRHKEEKDAEATLIRLRQRHDVIEELTDLKQLFVNKGKSINMGFRIALTLALQATFAIFMSNTLLLRVLVQPAPDQKGEQTSKWEVYFGLCNLIGVTISILLVDSVRRKTLLKDILPFAGAFAIVCGALAAAGLGDSVITKIALFVLFISAPLCLTSATWLTAIEVFPPYQRSRYVAMSFFFYYAVQAGLYAANLDFSIVHFIFAALSVVLTVAMFAVCASTKDGAIQLKGEKKRFKEEQASAEDIPSHVARASRSQSFLRSRVRRTSSRNHTKTPQNGDNYEYFESPAATQEDGSTRQGNTSVRFD